MGYFNRTSEENFYVDKLLKWVTDIVVVIMVALFFVSILGDKTEVVGNSMSPVLNNKESVLVNRFSYEFSSPDRYDIILFKMPENDDGKYFIKRIVGLPGERVQIKNGRIYIDGEQLDYNDDSEDIVTAGTASEEILLNDGEYFVIGDNWNNSEDSRAGTIGNVNERNIVGKVWFRISSIKDFGFIKK